MKFNTRFNLRKANSKKSEKIYLICRFRGERLVYPTSFNVIPKHWNKEKEEIRNVIEEIERDSINKYLRDLKQAAKSIYTNAIINNTPFTKEILKTELDKWTGKTFEEKPIFKSWLTNYIKDSNERINPKTGRKISYRTIQEYNTTFKYLMEFEKENREEIQFENISLSTLKDFRDFLTSVKSFAVNNIAKHIDNLRQFLRAAQLEGIAINPQAINPAHFLIKRENAENIYLNENELKQIEDLNLSENATLDKVRDLFLIGCFSGLRISDFTNIKPYNIKGNYIEIVQFKTGNKVTIPLHDVVRKIFKKYDNKSLPKISDQKFNLYIKDIAKKAKIKEQVEKQQTKGGEKIVQVLEKWQLVTSHTARRSFATNAVKRGIPVQVVMRITGHRKESVFLKYIKLNHFEFAEIMQKHLQQQL